MNKTTNEMTIEAARAEYRRLRTATCSGDVFAGLPKPAKFDALVKGRLAGVSNPTPAQWVEAAREVNQAEVSRSNFHDMLHRGTPSAYRKSYGRI